MGDGVILCMILNKGCFNWEYYNLSVWKVFFMNINMPMNMKLNHILIYFFVALTDSLAKSFDWIETFWWDGSGACSQFTGQY